MTNIQDLVARLRHWSVRTSFQNQDDADDAADTIERLAAALELITDGGTTGRSQSPALNMPDDDWLRYRINNLEHIARRALNGEG